MEIIKVYSAIDALVEHGIREGLCEECDRVYVTNTLLAKLGLDACEKGDEKLTGELLEYTQADRDTGMTGESEKCGTVRIFTGLEKALKILLDYAAEQGMLENDSTVYRDLFDTDLMSSMVARPSEIIGKFFELYKTGDAAGAEAATDWYYKISRASDYIRTYRVARDIKWTSSTEYGNLVITINLSKPEKDPKAIAAALSMKQSSYPKCQLCRENEGYAGRVNHPARQNHRIIPITINNTPWFLQYSPYVYYNEHCIVFNSEHTPMKIDHAAFDKLLDFLGQFPHYMVGSNADLPIVGGSILTHDHFQGGRYEFPMAKAVAEENVTIPGFDDVKAGIVKWPMTVLRISSLDPKRLADCADAVLRTWREYSDEEAFIYAYSDASTGEPVIKAPVRYDDHDPGYIPHNTITPIARRRGAEYELDLVLRNNITTKEHPLGLYHPHAEYHHIKKENIGLIEVMGLAILPARLKKELADLESAILEGRDIRADEALAKHAGWVDMIKVKYDKSQLLGADTLGRIIRDEVGLVYSSILEQCGVFKRNEEGRKQFIRFIESIRS